MVGSGFFNALVIPADIEQECYLQGIPKDHLTASLEQMQKLVNGYIELVRVDWGRLSNPDLPPGVHVARQALLYVNEESRFYPEMPHNPRASLLYPWQGGIYGDAFLCGPADPEGYDTDVPREAVEFYLNQTTPWRGASR